MFVTSYFINSKNCQCEPVTDKCESLIRSGSNQGFKAGNLNNMLRFSKGEIIVVFDSDFVPPKNFLRKIIKPFADKKVAAAQAKWSYMNMRQSITSKFGSTILMVYHNLLARINSIFGVSLLFGSGEAVRKDVLVKLGGWQEGSVTEDVEFSARLLKNGYKIAYVDKLEVAGEIPYNHKSLRIQQRRWAYGNMKALIEHRKGLLFGKLTIVQRLLVLATMAGYVSSFFLVAFMFFGALAFFTGEPAAVNLVQFSTDFTKNFLIASGLSLTKVCATKRKLSPGDLVCNKFNITISGCNHMENLELVMDEIRDRSVPNYFGPQRFGATNQNHIVGKLILENKFDRALEMINEMYGKHFKKLHQVEKRKLKFFINAYQSSLFNKEVERYVKNHYNPSFADIEIEKFQVDELSITCSGDTRKAFVMPDDLSFSVKGDKITLSFALPKGSYATVLIREVTKCK